jgi:hypothetical protein
VSIGVCCSLQVADSCQQLKEKAAALTTTSDQLKLCKMELEGANAQLQVRRVAYRILCRLLSLLDRPHSQHDRL